jgi:hypothetical protein
MSKRVFGNGSVLAFTFSTREARFLDEDWLETDEIKSKIPGDWSASHAIAAAFVAIKQWGVECGYRFEGLGEPFLSSYSIRGGDSSLATVPASTVSDAMSTGDVHAIATAIKAWCDKQEAGGFIEHAARAADEVLKAGPVMGAVWTSTTTGGAIGKGRLEHILGVNAAFGENETKRLIDVARRIAPDSDLNRLHGEDVDVYEGSAVVYPEQMLFVAIKVFEA